MSNPQQRKLTMRRNQQIKKAKELASQGWSHRRIGERLGVSGSTVTKWLNPDSVREWNRRDNELRRDAKLAEAKTRDGRPCVECGTPLTRNAVRAGGVRCRECQHDRERRQRLARRHRIEYLWGLGRSLREIADDLGSTPGSVNVEITSMRREGGWDVPHRYAMQDGRRVAA